MSLTRRSFSPRHQPVSGVQLAAQAIREGRHSERFASLCHGCDQWVEGIFHVTEQHKRLCRDCAIKAGAFTPAKEIRP